MTAYIDPCDDCGATCVGCGRTWCRAETTSPGEASDLCTDCYETEDDIEEGKLRARDYEAWAAL